MSTSFHPDEFPREKLLNYGVETLTDYELLAILLNTGTKNESVLEIAKKLSLKYNLQKLSGISISQLKSEYGIGQVKACKIISCFELGRRMKEPDKREKIFVNCAEDIAKVLSPKIQHLEQECLMAVFLNARKKIISKRKIFIGSLSESIINPREIFKYALEEGAAAIILAHNHPSGDPTPSESDLKSTTEIIKAGKFMGIEILDHVILGKNNYWSLNENGLI